MASYNKTSTGKNMTTNLSGHAAYRLGDRERLVTMALTTMLGEPKFYGDNTDELIQLAESMCDAGDGEFVAKLAVWARTEGNLRSVSHALASVTANRCKGDESVCTEPSFVRPSCRIIASMRGDDGTEMYSTYKALYGKPFRTSMKRGIHDALGVSTPYDVAKYQLSSREFKLRDVVRLAHPEPSTQELSDAFGALVDGTLAAPKGWQTELSAHGNTKDVWNELIAERKLGYMACVRNLRNIIKSGADVDPVLDYISNPNAVRKSRQLPFRYWSAYKSLVADRLLSTKVTRAIDSALIASCDNVERLPGRTAVLIDSSGSMGYSVSEKSDSSCFEIAALLGAMFTHISDEAWVAVFSTHAEKVDLMGTSVLSDMARIPFHNGGTNMMAGFELLCRSGFDADRVIVLSDNEVNGGGGWWGRRSGTQVVQAGLDKYRAMRGHDVWCHAIDLMGYGTSQFIGPKVNVMAGWSDKVLGFVSRVENGSSLVAEIESIQL